MLWLLILPGAALALWLAAIAVTTDLRVRSGNINAFKNVLAVFPHPDDETVNCGGTIHRFATAGAASTLVLLTGGERGNPLGVLDAGLQATRIAEGQRVARILGVSRLIQEDFGDGLLDQRRQEVSQYLSEMIQLIGPDLLLTHDLSGLDGHPDHVACAEILAELRRTQFPNTTLWCAGLPVRVLGVLKLVGQLRTPQAVDQRRAPPTLKIFIGAGVIAKIRAWYAYQSQRGLIAKGFGRLVPVWLALSAMQFEYFAEVR